MGPGKARVEGTKQKQSAKIAAGWRFVLLRVSAKVGRQHHVQPSGLSVPVSAGQRRQLPPETSSSGTATWPVTVARLAKSQDRVGKGRARRRQSMRRCPAAQGSSVPRHPLEGGMVPRENGSCLEISPDSQSTGRAALTYHGMHAWVPRPLTDASQVREP